MYREFMGQENSDFVTRAVTCLANEAGVQEGDGSFWVCYGSFALNQQTSESDLDLLCVHTQQTPVHRIQSFFEGHPVTIYSLNRNDFTNDGDKRSFGGYFAGKVLNPHVVLMGSERDNDMIARVGGKFIGSFASAMAERKERSVATSTNLMADSVLAQFHICPWYQSYFLRYYISPNFPHLWKVMEDMITLFFSKAGIVTQDGKVFRYHSTPSVEELHEKTIDAVARFWALGSCLHNNMFDFPAFYMQKAMQYVKDNELESRLEEMMNFLQMQSMNQNGRGHHGT